MSDTIFALSSGRPPAAIGVVRISGPQAGVALAALAGPLPVPRTAVVRDLRDAAGAMLDHALVMWFPGPRSATGEDLAEIHCHGGRAVIAAVERALADQPDVRHAEPGEFTRRAFANGRIDLAEAEGLADLLSSETELQRQAAIQSVSGGLSRQVEDWRLQVLGLAALVEAALDFSDEDDVAGLPETFHVERQELADALQRAIALPPAERLRDGVRVVLAGPPNAGKSSLFNAILDEGAAIVSAEAGTTRDVIERPVALAGVPFVLIDTAGLRDDGAGEIERIGIDRAQGEIARADIVLWLGAAGAGPEGACELATKADLVSASQDDARLRVSAVTHQGIAELIVELVERAKFLLPKPGTFALNARQLAAIADAHAALTAPANGDLLIIAEQLRSARQAFDRLLGRQSTEEMLDALFGRFCIGK